VDHHLPTPSQERPPSPRNPFKLCLSPPRLAAETSESYFTYASGKLGWNASAPVGIALAQKHLNTSRLIILTVGDSSLNYSDQSIYTAVQQK